MDRDPDEAQRYLEGVEYPVDKATLLSTVEGNGAPGELIELIQGMPLGEFSGPGCTAPAWAIGRCKGGACENNCCQGGDPGRPNQEPPLRLLVPYGDGFIPRGTARLRPPFGPPPREVPRARAAAALRPAARNAGEGAGYGSRGRGLQGAFQARARGHPAGKRPMTRPRAASRPR